MNILSVNDLAVSYGPVAALRGISLNVEESETVAVLGANGAGKSTLLRTISGLIHPSSGSVSFDGQQIHQLPADEVAALRLSHVPEGRNVFGEMTVEHNLVVGAYRLRRERQRIQSLLGEVYDLFPRLAERKGQAAASLSGGEQQMLALGRALMSEPKLLMLDEPSLGLAPIIVARVFESIRHMQSRGMTILLVEQNAALALRHCSRAYVLSLGEIATEGPGEVLLKDPAVQNAYLGSDVPEIPEVDYQSPTSFQGLARRFRPRSH